MADPISITTGVIGLVQGSVTIFKILKSATTTPQELARLQEELEHLGDVVQDIERESNGRGDMTDNLMKNIKNAQLKIKEIHNFIQTQIYKNSDVLSIRRTALIRERPKLKAFAKDVEAARSRLVDCLTTLNFQRTLHTPSQMTDAGGPDPSSTPFPIVETDQRVVRTTDLQAPSPVARTDQVRRESPTESILPDDSFLRQSTPTDSAELSDSTQERTSSAVASLVWRTRHATGADNDVLLKHLVQIYREIGENRSQMECLTRALRTPGDSQQMRLLPATVREAEAEDMYTSEDSRSASDVSDIFLDCVSRFSEPLSDTSMERLKAKFTGTPDYFLEKNPMFFPEQFTLNPLFACTVSVAAMKAVQSSNIHRVQKYYLMYDHAPRAWRKVTVHASIISLCTQSAFPGLAAQYDAVTGRRILPGDVRSQLETIVRSQRLRYPVTNISLTLMEDADGQVTVDKTHISLTKDVSESQTDDERDMLQAVDIMGCPQFLQTEVIPRKRRGAYTSVVQVESQLCFEYRMPFTGAGLPGHNRVLEFYRDLKKLYSLRECSNVVRFVGVVLDDSRKHLKSYLKEFPRINSLMTVFADAELHGKRIPWSVRAVWAKQIISAVDYVHSKGFTVEGLYTLHNIGLRSDGSAILMALGTQYMGFDEMNQRGQMPPEARNQANNTMSEWNQLPRDIFSLGLVLWLLAEHKAAPEGQYCRINACTNWPRYSCSASHSNPVELPRCTDSDVPEWFSTVISHCRQSKPAARLSARDLLHYFDAVSAPPDMSEIVDDVVNEYQMKQSFDTFAVCDECGALTDLYHHCAICKLGNFDLCTDCVRAGVHCYVPEHLLTEHKVLGS